MHFTLGKFQFQMAGDGVFRIDGGTVFGVVPRALWEKIVTPDAQNRVPLGLNSLVVRTPDALVVVETGIGTKLDEKSRRHHDFGTGTLVAELAKLGVAPRDVDIVIDTHLHFDHCGGNTFLDAGKVRPTFPRAKYVIQKREWEDATHPDGLTAAGYDPDDFAVLEETRQLELVDGEAEVAPGIVCRRTGGHTHGHQMVLVHAAGRTVCYPGDIMPNPWFVRPNYITAYDLCQEETYRQKVKLLEEAVPERWVLAWGHGLDEVFSVLERTGGRFATRPLREV